MPVDSSIYGQIQPVRAPNILQEAALAGQVQQGGIRNALLARQVGRQNAMEQALAAGAGADELRRAGFLDESLKLDKAARENKQLDANIAKTNAETGNIDFEQGLKKAEHAASVLSLAKDQQSYDTVLKVLGSTFGEKSVAQMPAVFDPAYVQAEVAKGLTRAQQLADLRAQQGQAVTMRGQDLTAETARRGQDITVRGQNLTDARAREANANGKVPPGYRLKPDGTMEPVPGGPADIKANAEGQKKISEAKDVLGLLDQVDALLPKATGSYLGAGVDQTARFFGKATPGAEATGQLKALEGALISKMPKMSGPQSDRDVQLYREMAGQVADPTIPVEQRQAASATIRSLNEKYAGMPAGSSKAAKTVTRTGMLNGRKVVQYSDGTTAYAD